MAAADLREVPIVISLAIIQCIMVVLRHRKRRAFTHQELEATAGQQSAMVDILTGIQHLVGTLLQLRPVTYMAYVT